MAGLLLDYSKCFDRLPHVIMLQLARASSASERLLAPLHRIYRVMRRRFKVAGGVCQEFRATNGILQGCPLSVILLNLLVSVWCRTVAAETAALPEAYADDTGVMGSRSAVEQAGAVTSEYCQLTGQALNVRKCKAFYVNRRASSPPIRLQGVDVEETSAARCLGADIRFAPMAAESSHVTQRVDNAVATAHRIAVLPLPMDLRVRMLATQPCASAFHGVEVMQWSQSLVTRLSLKIMTAIWGDSRRNRCKEIVLSLFAPGHQVDPLQALPYRCLVGLVRMAQRRPDVRALILKVRWVQASYSGSSSRGSIRAPRPSSGPTPTAATPLSICSCCGLSSWASGGCSEERGRLGGQDSAITCCPACLSWRWFPWLR